MNHFKLIDRPLDSIEHESLGFKDYAHVLSDFIRSCETPLTIGIQGDWGIGKTSLLNMVAEDLTPEDGRARQYPVVYLNTWQYAQFNSEEMLGAVILRGLIEEIKTVFHDRRKHIVDGAKKLFSGLVSAADQLAKNRYGVSVRAAADAASNDGIDLGVTNSAALVRDYKSKFEQLVDELIEEDWCKLVVMIDDLDRLRPERALELLEVMKNFLDVPNCVFVLAVDYAVIQRGVRAKFGTETQARHGKSFFDKIIQIPFNMPVSSYHVDRYILSLMGWQYDPHRREYIKAYTGEDADKFFLRIRNTSLKTEDADYFSNMTQLTVGNNPRSIKRAVNYANLLRMVVKRTRSGSGHTWKLDDAKITYALACMQLAWPELFNYFAEKPVPSTIDKLEDWAYLESLPHARALFDRVGEVQSLKSNITGFFDELVYLIDRNQDGQISTKEFEPIWTIMDEANLTSVPLQDDNEVWEEFSERALQLNQDSSRPWPAEQIGATVRLFRRGDSKWSNRVFFKILPAGKRFYNLTWDDLQIGSLATTKSEPIQLYLKGDPQQLASAVSGHTRRYIEDVTGIGHYGTGNTKVDIRRLLSCSSEQQVTVMNDLLTSLLALPYSSGDTTQIVTNTDNAYVPPKQGLAESSTVAG